MANGHRRLWTKTRASDLHAIAKGLEDLKKQISMQLNKKVPDLITLSEYYEMDTLDDEMYSLQFKLIQVEQQKDKQLLEKARTSSVNYKVKDFLGGGKKHQLMCLNEKIAVLKSLQ
eukprot:2975044-Ditylum_brightwellii.AAC.1